MRAYSPAPPPQEQGHLARYLVDELNRLAALLMETTMLPEMHRAPEKPRTGMLVFADGTNWNPGSGRGVYVYDGGWVKL